MKRPTMLLSWILRNAGILASVAVERDLREIEDRFEHEGLSFLTIALPVLCDALDQGLARGRIAPSDFPGFKPASRGGSLPALLRGFFIRVFNEDGSLLSEPCIDSIFAIRQVTRCFKKLEYPCTDTRNVRAFERYIENDESLCGTCSLPGDRSVLRVVAGYLWSDLEGLSGELYCSPGVFGSGACAERAGFNARHDVKLWPERAELCFPMAFHTSHNEGDTETFNGIGIISPESEPPVRVVGVPKTLKTPRIISIEPSYMMLMQQSVMTRLVDWLESGRLGFKSIRFTDQTVNRDLARLGSVDGHLSTIDLSDASDRVSNDLVCEIFGPVAPSFLEYIQACRSRSAKMPDGRVIFLRKFASMGSALCFPIEAMVFFTIAVASMLVTSGMRPSRRNIRSITAKIAVYGDDIIVPSETAVGVMDWLEAFELKVNHSKSFTQGLFRESCGGDYWAGVDVTPAYVRRFDFSGKRLRGQYLISYISLSNQLYMKGLWNASQQIRDLVHQHLGGKPLSRTRSPVGVHTWTSVLYNTGLRWDTDRCGWKARGVEAKAGTKPDSCQTMSGHMLRIFGSVFRNEIKKNDGQHHSWSSSRSNGGSSLEHVMPLQTGDVDGRIGSLGIEQLDSFLGDARGVSPDTMLDSEYDFDGTGRPVRGCLQDLEDWERFYQSRRIPWWVHLDGLSLPQDLLASVRSQSLNTKIGWAPALEAGLRWG